MKTPPPFSTLVRMAKEREHGESADGAEHESPRLVELSGVPEVGVNDVRCCSEDRTTDRALLLGNDFVEFRLVAGGEGERDCRRKTVGRGIAQI